MISAMNIEQCWPSATPPSAADRLCAELRRRSRSPRSGAPCSSMNEPVPGAARLVHRGVHDAPAGEPDVLRVLAADLEDRVDARVVVLRARRRARQSRSGRTPRRCRSRWRGASPQSRGRCRWRRTRGRGSSPPGPSRNVAHERLRGAHGVAARAQVALPERLAAWRGRERRPSIRWSRCRSRGSTSRRLAASTGAAAPSCGGRGGARAERRRGVSSGRRAAGGESSSARARGPACSAASSAQPTASRTERRLRCRRRASSIPCRSRKRAEVLANAARTRATPPARNTRGGRAPRLHEHLDVLADRVEESREDAVLPLALVREVRHVGLEDDRAAAGERRGLGDRRPRARAASSTLRPNRSTSWRRKLPVPCAQRQFSR